MDVTCTRCGAVSDGLLDAERHARTHDGPWCPRCNHADARHIATARGAACTTCNVRGNGPCADALIAAAQYAKDGTR